MEEKQAVVAEENNNKPENEGNFSKKVDKFFGISKSGSSFKVEIFAGITTFLAMCYILVVNPNSILGTTVNATWSSVFLATAFGAVIGTLLMSLLAKMPYAQASGMGLNSQVGLLLGGVAGFTYSLGSAFLLVLISGILFLLLSFIPGKRDKETGRLVALRELLFDGMPKCIRTAIPVGIGLFIAYLGLQNCGLIIHNEFTQVGFMDFKNWIYSIVKGVPLNEQVVATQYGNPKTLTLASGFVCIFGLIVIAVLHHYKVKGSVIIGVIAATILALPLGVANGDIFLGKVDGVSWKFWESFGAYFSMKPEDGGVLFATFTEGFDFPKGAVMNSIMTIIAFCMIDMFDTMGTVVGCSTNAGLVDEDGKPLNYNKIMYSDSIATCTGALLGTSTVTTFVESGTGIAEGGRTGFTALITAALFLLSVFLLPLFAFIPSAATASALIYVGVVMIGSVKNIDFKEITNAIPAFLVIIMMPLTYSITNGIGIGIIFYVVLNALVYLVDIIKYAITKKEKPQWKISIVCLVIFLLFLVYFLVPTNFN